MNNIEMTDEYLRQKLRDMADKTSVTQCAIDIGVNRTFLSGVIHGREKLTPRLREYLGYHIVCKIEKIK